MNEEIERMLLSENEDDFNLAIRLLDDKVEALEMTPEEVMVYVSEVCKGKYTIYTEKPNKEYIRRMKKYGSGLWDHIKQNPSKAEIKRVSLDMMKAVLNDMFVGRSKNRNIVINTGQAGMDIINKIIKDESDK